MRPTPVTYWKHSLVLLLSLANSVHALQVVAAHDGETGLAKISRKEVTATPSRRLVDGISAPLFSVRDPT